MSIRSILLHTHFLQAGYMLATCRAHHRHGEMMQFARGEFARSAKRWYKLHCPIASVRSCKSLFEWVMHIICNHTSGSQLFRAVALGSAPVCIVVAWGALGIEGLVSLVSSSANPRRDSRERMCYSNNGRWGLFNTAAVSSRGGGGGKVSMDDNFIGPVITLHNEVPGNRTFTKQNSYKEI